MDLDVAVVGVGFAGQQALKLELLGLRAQIPERRFALRDDDFVTLGFAAVDEGQRILALPLDAAHLVDRLRQERALAHHFPRAHLMLSTRRILCSGVQLVEASECVVPVKDASGYGRGWRTCNPPAG